MNYSSIDETGSESQAKDSSHQLENARRGLDINNERRFVFKHYTKVLVTLCAEFGLKDSTFRIIKILYGESIETGTEFVRKTHLQLLRLYEKERVPNPTDYDGGKDNQIYKQAVESAMKFMSRKIKAVMNDFKCAGIPHLFIYEPGTKSGEVSRYKVPLLTCAAEVLRDVYQHQQELGTYKGMEKAIEELTVQYAAELRNSAPKLLAKVAPDPSERDYYAESKSIVGRLDKAMGKYAESHDFRNFSYLRDGVLASVITNTIEYCTQEARQELYDNIARMLPMLVMGGGAPFYPPRNGDTKSNGAGGGGNQDTCLPPNFVGVDGMQVNENAMLNISGLCEVEDFDAQTELSARLFDAEQTLDTFSRTHLSKIDITFIDEDTKTPVGYKKDVPISEIKKKMLQRFLEQEKTHRSLVIRPYAEGGFLFIQLDDLNNADVEQLKHLAFFCVRTSFYETGFQAWLCVQASDKTIATAVRRRFNSDQSASGAVKLPGSLNCKREYAPGFPVVRAIHLNPSRVLTVDELKENGLLAGSFTPSRVEEPPAVSVKSESKKPHRSTWPDYDKSLKNAKQKRNGEPDRSDADFRFAACCWHWGFREKEAVVTKLLKVSESNRIKAQGQLYAELTVKRAFEHAQKSGGKDSYTRAKVDLSESRRIIQEELGVIMPTPFSDTDNQLPIDFADAEDVRQNDDLEPQPLRAGTAISGFDFEEDEAELPDWLFSAEDVVRS